MILLMLRFSPPIRIELFTSRYGSAALSNKTPHKYLIKQVQHQASVSQDLLQNHWSFLLDAKQHAIMTKTRQHSRRIRTDRYVQLPPLPVRLWGMVPCPWLYPTPQCAKPLDPIPLNILTPPPDTQTPRKDRVPGISYPLMSLGPRKFSLQHVPPFNIYFSNLKHKWLICL